MKSIEQKLKTDAQAFNHEPDVILHENIMQSIQSNNAEALPNTTKTANTFLKWTIATGIALSALLVFTIYQPKAIKTNDTLVDSTAPVENTVIKNVIKDSDNPQFDIDSFVASYETKLTNPIEAEQKAISNDLNYFKSLLAL